MYGRAEQWSLAVEAFEQSHCWQLALCMADKAQYDTGKKRELCARLAGESMLYKHICWHMKRKAEGGKGLGKDSNSPTISYIQRSKLML